MNKIITIFDNLKPMMMFKKLTLLLVLICVQYFAIAQDKPKYQKLKHEADSLAKLGEFARSEAKEQAKYRSQSKQHKSISKIGDKTSWIDDFRRTF
jgi:glucan phosphoethanolaminetransferase (alkaline phosphatase superfamily)